MDFFEVLKADLQAAEDEHKLIQRKASGSSYFKAVITLKISEKIKEYSQTETDMQKVFSKIVKEIPDDVEDMIDSAKFAKVKSAEKVNTLRAAVTKFKKFKKTFHNSTEEKELLPEAAKEAAVAEAALEKKERPRKPQEKPENKIKRRRRKSVKEEV